MTSLAVELCLLRVRKSQHTFELYFTTTTACQELFVRERSSGAYGAAGYLISLLVVQSALLLLLTAAQCAAFYWLVGLRSTAGGVRVCVCVGVGGHI